jgi:hypothetical protein
MRWRANGCCAVTVLGLTADDLSIVGKSWAAHTIAVYPNASSTK